MGSRYFIVYTVRKPKAVEKARELEMMIKNRGFIVDSMQIEDTVERGIPADTEALIVLGGDGTLLKSVSILPRPSIPILTINYGRGGYLMEVEPERSLKAVEDVLEGRYEIEKAIMLSFLIDRKKIADALNEAYISTVVPGKIIEFKVERNDVELYNGVGDALIISTPLGSTAYAFSAGGPAVDDHLESAVLVPVCPLTNIRSVVLSLTNNFTITVESNTDIQILIDGHTQRTFKKYVKLEVRKSEDYVSFIRFRDGESFARRLKKRFKS
ncbi:MAG: NAD(+)/NADH kinase [Aigarchaeota archaeon]|nr:NAD(+)/NADH kinase [Aigarchaeota archaeon]MCX8192419.1 NAD(+)/NADH kinase [Nitrososphaeria archaeon]MDW7986625.1 NAD(+)/NADH kinase [Nitrososphaerota archaeon]